MRKFLQNATIAVISSLCTFCLCIYFLQSDAEAEVSSAAQLVSRQSPSPVNASPRDWSAMLGFPDFSDVAKRVTDPVVSITTYGTTGYRVSSGSGVTVSADGHIMTNYHVVEEGQTFEVVLADNRTLPARLVGYDKNTDLALLHVNERNLPTMYFGDSDDVEIGAWVLAVGNPFDLNSTVTAGIVSAKARNINILRNTYSIESFIQTDAVVNPGNSGGALVNTRGELVGINTAIISESGGYEGYSFAIPSNLVKKVFTDLRDFGEVKRAILGVSISEVNARIAADLALPSVGGIYITNVNRGSGAYEAGLRAGDVIVKINEASVMSVPELQEQVALFRPGDRISLEYYRRGRKYRTDNVPLKSIDAITSSRYR
jgi:S1-C subfamily serine protease